MATSSVFGLSIHSVPAFICLVHSAARSDSPATPRSDETVASAPSEPGATSVFSPFFANSTPPSSAIAPTVLKTSRTSASATSAAASAFFSSPKSVSSPPPGRGISIDDGGR